MEINFRFWNSLGKTKAVRAKEHRQRKKEYYAKLEQRVVELENEVLSLQHENKRLNEKLKTQNKKDERGDEENKIDIHKLNVLENKLKSEEHYYYDKLTKSIKKSPELVRFSSIYNSQELIGYYGSYRIALLKASFDTFIKNILPYQARIHL